MCPITDTELAEDIAMSRSRSSWNDRLAHWERPASDTEEVKIERAAKNAREVVNGNTVLLRENVTICPQGSYFNNTNVRLESDMDLRVQLPGIRVECESSVDRARAYKEEGYSDTGRSFVDIAASVRDALAKDCRAKFGKHRVSAGNKAITVDGLSGSTADVDLVPAFRLHWISNNGSGGYNVTEGVAIIGSDGAVTLNFPEQHHSNGKRKRTATSHRFKKVVRMLKCLNYELAELDLIEKKIPSFLVECLVYVVANRHFLYEEDRYDRLIRVLRQARSLLADVEWTTTATEVNEIKYLFHVKQAWTLAQAEAFVTAALARLEA